MPRKRDPSPFGSRVRRVSDRDINTISTGMFAPDADVAGDPQRSADLFERLRAQRFARIRFAIELVLLAIGIYLVTGLPPALPMVGALILVVVGLIAFNDFLTLRRLKRTLSEAWVDLPRQND